jgi:putative endopeptidase
LAWQRYFALAGVPPHAYASVGDPKALGAASAAFATASLESWRDYLTLQYLELGMAESFGGDNPDDLRVAENRESACLDETEVQLGWILGRQYVVGNFSRQAKARVDTILGNIRSVLRDELQNVTWMSASTRAEALRKLDAFTVELGYPDRWPDFSQVDVAPGSFWMNALSTKAYRTKLELARIHKRASRDDWWQGYWPETSDGYFNPDLNEVVLAAGYIQPPMFDALADDASNYGGIGAVIGHEMTHAFDQNGREYDSQGKRRDWWTPSDRRVYDSLASRVVTQYDRFTAVETLHVNGRQTLNENLADIGGLKLAYLALERELEGKPRELIGGLTPEQRFFIAYAQSRRGLFGSEYLRDKVRQNSHAPDRWRVLGPVMNMPEFARAFGCRAGDAMVLREEDRVRLW